VLVSNAIAIASAPSSPMNRFPTHVHQPMVNSNATFETLTAQIDRCQRRVALQRIRNLFGTIVTDFGT
jgi:hypothetical protein